LTPFPDTVGTDNINAPESLDKLANILKPYANKKSTVTLDGCNTAGDEDSMFDSNFNHDPTDGSEAKELSKRLPGVKINGYQDYRYGPSDNSYHFGYSGPTGFLNGKRL